MPISGHPHVQTDQLAPILRMNDVLPTSLYSIAHIPDDNNDKNMTVASFVSFGFENSLFSSKHFPCVFHERPWLDHKCDETMAKKNDDQHMNNRSFAASAGNKANGLLMYMYTIVQQTNHITTQSFLHSNFVSLLKTE